MKICYFGIYNPDYSRNRIIMKGLKANGIEIVECRSMKKGVIKYFDLILKYLALKNDFNTVLVGFPGQQSVVLIKMLIGKRIIFDAFTSLYDSLAEDRKVIKSNSIKAKYYWWIDKLSCQLADKIIVDTDEHADYYMKTFGLPREKFIKAYVGSDAVDFLDISAKPQNKRLEVLFYGSFIPLQGAEKVITAANILKNRQDIHFYIIGTKIKEVFADNNPLPNVTYVSNVDFGDLVRLISRADICLGIFGDTVKSNRVIPNKVYDGIALGKIVISKKSKAISELFRDKHDMYFVDNTAESIAGKILEVKNDPEGSRLISNNANMVYQDKLTPKLIVKEIIKEIKT